MKCSILQMQKELRVDKPSDRPDSTASRKMPVLKEANTSSPLKRTLSSSFKNSIHAPLRSPLSVCVPKPATVGASSPKSTVLNRTNSTSKSLRQIMNNQVVNNTNNNNENLSLSGELDPLRSPMRPNGNGVYIRLRTPEGSFRSSTCSQDVVIESRELRRGYEVAGCLYKWVNYGKGWKSRWFVLREGVLSYYKIHGPDKIAVTEETEKGLKVIGEHSVELMMRKKPKSSAANTSGRKTAGIVHLKVSSVRESKSDDKKFSIFSGTKTLHLRAETREDRAAWVEALATAKEQFPSSSLSMGHLLPIQEITVSTEKLRNRLQEAGLDEDIIKDCEDIMLAEFSKLQDELDSLQQRGCTLIDTLRQLEAEKVELETTVVDESQYCSKARHYSTELGQGKSSGTATESDDDNERANGAELESDEEDDAFFDTTESLSDSFRGSGSGFRRLSTASEDELIDCEDFSDDSNGADSESEIHGLGFPRVERRKSLPEPVEKEKGVSLWSMIKDNIGKDLTRVCLPVYFNEPLSSLQKCFEDLEYSYLIDRANEFGKKGNNLMRILNVAAFAVSAYASSEGRNCKPFNPLLGETYEAEYPDKGLHFLAEKVSHHPMLIACHCEGRGWKFWGDSNLKSKFWGRSIQLDPVGVLSLQFDDGEVFQWSKVTTSIYNLILGKLYCDHYGTMRIQGNGEYTCKLKFKEQSIIDRNPHQVQGFVQDKSGNKVATLLGKWDESMFYVIGDITTKPKGYDPMSEACLLWKRSKPPKNPTRYNLTSFAITLNELTPGLKENLPPTDSRLRPDQRYLENGQYELANSEKLRLEQRQRQSRKLQETGWQPRWFRKEKGHDTYKYIGGYWEARDKHQWNDCLDVFGQTSDDTANE